MTVRRYIAALSLLTSVLLGGLIAPLSHFAYMAWSDSYNVAVAEMSGDGMDSMHHRSADVASSGNVDLVATGTSHVECPFAAFFLNQASAVASDAAYVVDLNAASGSFCLSAESLASRAVPSLIARGPPALAQISA